MLRTSQLAGLICLLFPNLLWACFMQAPLPVQVTLDRIEVEIVDGIAIKSYECHFRNPNGGAIVGGICYMEVAPGAQIDNMAMVVNGTTVEAELLDVEKANQVFQDIVKNGGSPALLEYYGNQLIRTTVPSVPAGGTVIVKLQYTQPLRADDGVYRLRMLNTNPKMAMQMLEHASIDITIRSTDPVTNVYSPTHNIEVEELTETDGIHVTWSQDNYMPENAFVFYYATAQNPVGLNVLTHKEADEDGHFMMMLAPRLGDESEIAAKDIVFCVDTSGSMLKDGKMDQAQAALRHCIRALRPGDRFNIVSFSTEARVLAREGLLDATEENQARALRYIDKLRARGGTAILESLQLSLGQFEDDARLKMVFFATDGLPTIGEQQGDAILAEVRKANHHDARIFTFGEGLEVNARMLDLLAYENHGDVDYILPREDIASKIARYFDKVGSPLLTDLEVEVSGVEVSEVYPRVIRDLFKGEQIMIFGRFEGSGEATITLTGKVNGQERTFQYAAVFPEKTGTHDFVPRLWAGRKVEFLLGQVRQNGEDSELIDEIVRLAKLHGIVTPYTAFLAAPDTVLFGEGTVAGLANTLSDDLERELKDFGGLAAPTAEALGREVDESRRLAAGRDRPDGGAFYLRAQLELDALGYGGTILDRMRLVGNRTFYQQAGRWVDSRFETGSEDIITLTKGSDAFFEFLADNTEAVPYLAMDHVLFEHAGRFYEVVE